MSGPAVRVTFVLPAYPRYPIGGYRVVYEYANRLVARGHRVSVLHARRLPNRGPAPAGLPLGRLRRAAADLRDLVSAPAVRWMTVDERVRLLFAPDLDEKRVPDADVVVATAWQTAEYVAGYSSRKGVGHYLIQHVEYLLQSADGTGPLRTRVEESWRLPLRKIAVSEWIARRVGEAAGGSGVVVIPPGIDPSRFRPLRPPGERPRRATMMYSPAVCKAAGDGLAALRSARSKHPDLLVTLFGTARFPPGLSPWMEYRRNLSEEPLVALYNDSIVFLCSSLTEGFALPPAEAIACGCAVASTDCGGNREYAEHGVTALLSAPGDPEALGRNLLLLLEDEELRGRLASEGARRIRAFDWDRCTDRLEAFFRSGS